MAAILLWAKNEFSEITGQQTGIAVGYLNSSQLYQILRLAVDEITGKSVAEIRALAQARADADTGTTGATEREDILPNNIRAFLETAQAEVDYLDTNIPSILTLTTVPQLRVAVERLARENRQIIKALIRLAYR